jgi:GntR family transcriptional regulator of vanillate catabolism
LGISGKTQLVDHAVRELRARLLSGGFAPDTHLSEAGVAEMLGISRTPAREALAQLVEEGLLLRSSSGRCTVRLFTREDVADATELRGVLEGTVLRLAAERGADAEVLERCEEILAQIDTTLASGDDTLKFEGYARLNDSFHRTLAHVSGSETMQRELLRAIRLPFASPSAFPVQLYDRPRVRRTFVQAQEQHRSILDAVRRGEGSRAEALAREHARLAWEDYEEIMYRGTGETAAVPPHAILSGTRPARPALPTSQNGRTP